MNTVGNPQIDTLVSLTKELLQKIKTEKGIDEVRALNYAVGFLSAKLGIKEMEEIVKTFKA